MRVVCSIGVLAVVVILSPAGSASAQPVKNRLALLLDSSGSMVLTPEIVTFPETCVANNWNGCTASGNPTPAQEQCNACMAWTIRQSAGCATNFTSSCRTTYGNCWRFFNGGSAPACGQVLGVTAGVPTRGDGTTLTPGCDVDGDGQANDSRLFQAKEALRDVIATSDEVEFALWRYAQITGGQACGSDAQCADTPGGQSGLTCENVGGSNVCALDAAALGSAAGQCALLTWNGADGTFSCAQCSDVDEERLQCEAYALGQIRTGGASPLSGTVNCALPTTAHPFMLNRGAVFANGACDPTGADELVPFPTGGADNRPAIFSWIDHQNPLGADEITANGGTPLAASLRDLRTAIFDSARLDTNTPCRKHQVIIVTDGTETCESTAAAVTAAGTFQNMAFTNAAGVAVNDYDVPVYIIGFGVCPPGQPNCQSRQDLNAIAAAGATGSAILVNSQIELQQALEQIVANANQAEGACACGNSIVDAGEECDDGNTVDGDCCSATCQLAPNTTVCRPSTGVCDIAETCTGSSGMCPADTFQSPSTVCRPSAGVCDIAETCTGSSGMCPADTFQSSSTVCREASGECDIAEQCSGTSAQCPSDAVSPSGTTCPDDGVVCSTDLCNGSSKACQHLLAAEVCDGQDNDCDGVVDEGCSVVPSLGPARIWVGLTNSDDVGIRFDLRAEVYRNGTELVGSGEVTSVPGGSSGFNNAKQNTITFTPVAGVTFGSGDTLSTKLLVRNACSGSGKNSGRARLWYNDAAATSRLEATIGTPATYYLLDGFALGTTPGAGPKKTIDVAAGAKCSPFKLFGTWSLTLP